MTARTFQIGDGTIAFEDKTPLPDLSGLEHRMLRHTVLTGGGALEPTAKADLLAWWNELRGTETVKVALTRAVRSLTLRGHLLSNCSRNAIITTFLKKTIDIDWTRI
jgi:hypothetical protein